MPAATQPTAALQPQLLSHILDQRAKRHPERPFALVPRPGHEEEPHPPFTTVTIANFAHACNHAAHWLDTTFGRLAPGSTQIVAYSGPTDLRYPALVVAAIKTRRTLLLPGLALPADSFQYMLELFDCRHYIDAGHPRTRARDLEVQRRRFPHLTQLPAPPVEQWFGGGAAPAYPDARTWAAARNKAAFIIHTSGSTGKPKPLVFTNGAIATYDARQTLKDDGERMILGQCSGKLLYAPFSYAHLGGLGLSFLYALYLEYAIVLGPALLQPTAAMLQHLLDTTDVSAAILPPYLIEEAARQPPLLAKLHRLNFILWGSAPLTRSAGDAVARVTKLQTMYGTTEASFPLLYHTDAEDWDYVHLHPECGIEMVHRTRDLYELAVIRHDHLSHRQQVFHMFPDTHAYFTGDLFRQHPTKDQLWKYCGRVDDMITLAGSPTIHLHVTQMELAVQEHPAVRSAVIGGEGRFRPFLLVELVEPAPTMSPEEHATRVAQLDAALAAANALTIPEAHLRPELVLIAPGDQAFKRVAKGSVDRRNTQAAFANRIDGMYRALDTS